MKIQILFLNVLVGVGFFLALGCNDTPAVQKKEVATTSPEVQAVAQALKEVGGEIEFDEDDDEKETITIRTGNSLKVDDKWLKEHTDEFKKLKNLSSVVLLGTAVTQKGVAALKKALPKVEIQSDFDNKKKK